MPTPFESRAILQTLTGEAVATTTALSEQVAGSPEVRRAALLEVVPPIVAYFSSGSAALASDFYEEQRELADVAGGYIPELVVVDRTVKLRRAIAWATEPWFGEMDATVGGRLGEVVQLDVARAYRDTITGNRQNDPAAVGWRRITNGGCKFCRMLADKGAVYRQETARFAAHPNCHCTAQPVFKTDVGQEASALQYMASKRTRTAKEKEALRSYLTTFYADFPG